jgi:hypothetical protein
LNMSIETLVLLALFIVLSLIRQLIGRRERKRLLRPAERRSPETLARKPPPELALPPLTETAPRAASDATPASALVPARHGGGPVPIALTPHLTLEQQTAVGLRTRRDLRSAIVLVAVLGPCRANSPYGWPDQSAHP